jgi:hypothetical protein
MGPFETIALVAVVFAMVKILGPVGVAIGDRIRGRSHPREADPLLSEEVEALRERVRQLEDMQPRVGELEERVDFAERLLAQPHQPARMAAPDGSVGR